MQKIINLIEDFPKFFGKRFFSINDFFPWKKNLTTLEDNLEKTENQLNKTNQNVEKNSTLMREEKIFLESRKRHQVYTALDYYLSFHSYFDFFSMDSFNVAKYAKYLAQMAGKKIVTTDFLFLAFFYLESEIVEILEKYKLDKVEIAEFISKNYKKALKKDEKKKKYLSFSFKEFLENSMFSFLLSSFEEETEFDYTIQYSLEVHHLFEKAVENAKIRFRTPVITTEILFLTLMEEKNSKAARLVDYFLPEKEDWLLLRYALLKKLHYQESCLKNKLKKNYHYFAYLLKTQLLDNEYQKVIEGDDFEEIVLFFRKKIIQKVLEKDLFQDIEQDVFSSIRANFYERTYST